MSQPTIQANKILITALLLSLFAVFGAALVGLTFTQTEDDIKRNEEITLLNKLNNIIPSELYDNDLLLDTIKLAPSPLLGTKQPSTAYRARKDNKNVAVVFSCIAPNGYSGSIYLLVGIYADGKVAGVRVVKHKETPGLGDVVSITHSNWILGFNGKSLGNPDDRGWQVKRDGGVFDQFTGATVTPRAIVKAVYNSLLYFKAHQKTIFESVVPSSNKDSDTHEHN